MTLEEAVALTTLGDVFSSSTEIVIKLPRLLDAALERLRKNGTYLSNDDRGFLRRLIIRECKPNGNLVATYEGIMRMSDYVRKHGDRPTGSVAKSVYAFYEQFKETTEKEAQMSFFRKSGCDNTCSKCGAPLPCEWH